MPLMPSIHLLVVKYQYLDIIHIKLLKMSVFYDKYKSLFANQTQVYPGTLAAKYSKDHFKTRMKVIEDKINRSRANTRSRFSVYNPEESLDTDPPICLSNIPVSLKGGRQFYPSSKTQKQEVPFTKQSLRLPVISQRQRTKIRDEHLQTIQRARTQPQVVASPQPKSTQSLTESCFIEFSQYKPQNNFEFLDRRMQDIRRINTYYNRERLNNYTEALLRRRDRKRNPERKSRVSEMLQREQEQLSAIQGYPYFRVSKL